MVEVKMEKSVNKCFYRLMEKRKMKAVKFLQNIGLSLTIGSIFAFGVFAQTENPKTRDRIAPNEVKTDVTETKTETTETKTDSNETVKSEPMTTATPPVSENKTVEPKTDEAENILPYYNNYLKEYRLGPNDVITVEVFGQCPDYCKNGITVPPTARISYPLIRNGVLVGGKTVEEVADEITKSLDEYIIEPKVTVTLDKAMSVRYSVLGKVSAPGVRIMDRKVSIYEAIVESGGITKDGDKKRVTLYRFDAQGKLTPQIVNLQEIERGKGEMIYLNPGDQVFVPDRGFRLNVNTVFDILSKASIVRLLFGSPF
jgi:protein involved in polysaccharide export with SLBB domain